MTTKLFTGQIRASDGTFLVWASDATDAGRYVTAALGDVADIQEVPRAEGTLVLLGPDGQPRRVVPSLAAEGAMPQARAAPPA